MGLREYQQYKKQKELLTFLNEEYGITKEDLNYLHEALVIVKEMKTAKPNVVDAETKKEYEEQKKLKLTPEQIVEAFAGETEDFYPYGKPKE